MAVPTTHDEGQRKNEHGADLKFRVDLGKRAAGKIDHGRDASRENAAKARAEGWSDGKLATQRTPTQ